MTANNPTKIICTIGPASESAEVISGLVQAGMDVARLNFSHGDHASVAALVKRVREAAEIHGKHVAILGDLQGPKIRTGDLEYGAPVLLEAGHDFTITVDTVTGTAQRVSTTYEHLPADVEPTDCILLDDA